MENSEPHWVYLVWLKNRKQLYHLQKNRAEEREELLDFVWFIINFEGKEDLRGNKLLVSTQ